VAAAAASASHRPHSAAGLIFLDAIVGSPPPLMIPPLRRRASCYSPPPAPYRTYVLGGAYKEGCRAGWPGGPGGNSDRRRTCLLATNRRSLNGLPELLFYSRFH
jgi:hypothetical protein